MTHVDLFSGIGGFTLAAGWAGFRTVAFCEIDPFCQEVLKERFGAVADAEGEYRRDESEDSRNGKKRGSRNVPDALNRNRPVLIPDIRALDGTRFRGATLLTGGFPCQPFSVAGKRKGKADTRHLWPEMLRVISEARPAWVIGENVAGIVNMELEQVCLDLEGEGYEVRPVVIPACAVGAPHRRDRVWIIAQDTLDRRGRIGESEKPGRERNERDAIAGNGERIHRAEDSDVRGHAGELGLPRIDGRRAGEKSSDGYRPPEHAENDSALNELSSRDAVGSRTDARSAPSRSRDSIGESDRHAPDAERGNGRTSKRGCGEDGGGEVKGGEVREASICGGLRRGHAPDADEGRIRRYQREGDSEGSVTRPSCAWDESWPEVATRLCRVDDGIPRRVDRLKALGNAIVPAVAYEIIKAIAEIERMK